MVNSRVRCISCSTPSFNCADNGGLPTIVMLASSWRCGRDVQRNRKAKVIGRNRVDRANSCQAWEFFATVVRVKDRSLVGLSKERDGAFPRNKVYSVNKEHPGLRPMSSAQTYNYRLHG
jgi:hypothetical protein